MLKKFVYILIVIIGAGCIYFALTKINEKKDNKTSENNKTTQEQSISDKKPTRDEFIEEATKLQMLAESTNGNETCKCYNVKELDHNTPMTGSILVYTSGDLFISNLWLSNGYYILDNSENVSSGLVEESDQTASIYCGESSANEKSSLCFSES